MEKSSKDHSSKLAIVEGSDSNAPSQNDFGVTSTTLLDSSLNELLPLSASDKCIAEQSPIKTDYLHTHYHLSNHQRHCYDSNSLSLISNKNNKYKKKKKTTVCKTEFMHSVLTAINAAEHQATTQEIENMNNVTVESKLEDSGVEKRVKIAEAVESEEQKEQVSEKDREEELQPNTKRSATTPVLSLPHYSFLVQFAPFYEMAIHEIIVECERRVANAPLKEQQEQTVHLRGTSNVSLNISTHSFDTPSSYLPSMVSTAIYCPSIVSTTLTAAAITPSIYTNNTTQNVNTKTNIIHSSHVNTLENLEHSNSLPMEQHTLTNQPTFLPCHMPHESIISLFTSLSRITYQEYHINNKTQTLNKNNSEKTNRGVHFAHECELVTFPHFCSPLVLIAGLAYLAKVALRCQCDYASVTWSNWYRLTTTALLIAWKMYKDDANGHSQSHVNAIFAHAANLPLREMNQRELDFLYLVDFDLLLEEREVISWVDWMERIAMRSGLKLSLWALVSQHYELLETHQPEHHSDNIGHGAHINNNESQIINKKNNVVSSGGGSNMSFITATTLPWEKTSNVQSVISSLTATDTTLVPLTHRSSITSLYPIRENASTNHLHDIKFDNNESQHSNVHVKNSLLQTHESLHSPLMQLSDAAYARAWSTQTQQQQQERDKLATKKNDRLFSVVYGWEPPSPTILSVDGHAPTLWDLAHAAFLPVPDDEDDDHANRKSGIYNRMINEDNAVRGNDEVAEEKRTTSPVSFFHKAHEMLHKHNKNTTKKGKAQNENDAVCNEMCYESGNNTNNTSRYNLCTPHDYMANGCSSTNITIKKQNNNVNSVNIDVENMSNDYNYSDNDHKSFTERLCKMNVNSIDANRHLTNQSVMGIHNLDSNNDNNEELKETSHQTLLKPQKDMKRTCQNSCTRLSIAPHCKDDYNVKKTNGKSCDSKHVDESRKKADETSKTTRRRWAPFGVVQRVREAFDITASLMRGELNVLVTSTNHQNEDNNSNSNVTPSIGGGSSSSKKDSPSSVVETSSRTHSTTEIVQERSNDDSRTLDENDMNGDEMILDNTTHKNNNNKDNNEEKSAINEALLLHNMHQITNKVQVASHNNQTHYTQNRTQMAKDNSNINNISHKDEDCYDDNDVDSEMDILTENDAEYANFYEYDEDELGYSHYGYEDDAMSELPSSGQHENYKSNLNTNIDSIDYASYEENELDEMSNEEFSSDANKEDNFNENEDDSDGFSDYNYHYTQRPPPMTHSPPSL